VVPEMGLSAELEERFPEYLEAATGFFANAM
jgi:hypothetical protein